jgi:hypothetical protein
MSDRRLEQQAIAEQVPVEGVLQQAECGDQPATTGGTGRGESY